MTREESEAKYYDSKKRGPLPIYMFTIGEVSGVLEFRILRGSGEVYTGEGVGVVRVQRVQGARDAGGEREGAGMLNARKARGAGVLGCG
jgi:hypothetical protein